MKIKQKRKIKTQIECKICNDNKLYNRLSSHVSNQHKMSFVDYLVIYEYNNIRPTCACGCMEYTEINKSKSNEFNKYRTGHNMLGTSRSEETKKKIGQKNSENMKLFFSNNPDIAKQRANKMRVAITDEIEEKRIEATKNTYEMMSEKEKEKFSIHAKELWKSGIMEEAKKKAVETWNKRYKNGNYDFTKRNEFISKKITEMYINGGIQWSRGCYTSTKSNKTFHFRSSWEQLFMVQLDKNPKVVWWDYEPFSIMYTWKNKNKRYIPDFLVKYIDSDIPKLIEIKPNNLRKTDLNKVKIEAAKKYAKNNNFEFEILTEKELLL